MFHTHSRYEVVSVTFTPGITGVTRVRMGDSDPRQFRRLMQGSTAIAQRCGVCGKIDVEVVTGKVEGLS